jgi:hypothetical protein
LPLLLELTKALLVSDTSSSSSSNSSSSVCKLVLPAVKVTLKLWRELAGTAGPAEPSQSQASGPHARWQMP